MELTNAYVTASWLGILTSISPCPLASNIAAVSFLAARGDKGAMVSGMAYALGRSLAYVALAWLIAWNLLSVPSVANFLASHMNQALGPLFILVGLVMLEIMKIPAIGLRPGKAASRLGERGGAFSSLLLGMVLALSFCPVSAALFFGSLLPMSLEQDSRLILPLLYGIGTALPVLGVAVALALGMGITARLFEGVRRFEFWARRITGTVFILVGCYYLWNHVIQPML